MLAHTSKNKTHKQAQQEKQAQKITLMHKKEHKCSDKVLQFRKSSHNPTQFCTSSHSDAVIPTRKHKFTKVKTKPKNIIKTHTISQKLKKFTEVPKKHTSSHTQTQEQPRIHKQ